MPGTENNNLNARSYQKEFKSLLKAVYGVRGYFADFFGGALEALDGVQENQTAFSVKTCDIPVVVGQNYNTGANVAFGTGTSNSNRFGERKEVIYIDTDVPYSWGWNFHEGIDRYTVNNSLESAVADRLDLHAQAKTRLFNNAHAKFIATSAGHTEILADYTEDNVTALFDALFNYYLEIEAIGTKVAKVNGALYAAIMKHPLTVTEKGSTPNMDTNTLARFKDFNIEVMPDSVLTDGTNVYACLAYITGIGKAFTGINTARTIESEDFDGVALQGAGRAGEFVLDDNKKAIVTVAAPNA
jgi:hypothetical protein